MDACHAAAAVPATGPRAPNPTPARIRGALTAKAETASPAPLRADRKGCARTCAPAARRNLGCFVSVGFGVAGIPSEFVLQQRDGGQVVRARLTIPLL